MFQKDSIGLVLSSNFQASILFDFGKVP